MDSIITIKGKEEGLCAEDLTALAGGDVAAIRCIGFCSRRACDQLASLLLSDTMRWEHPRAPGLLTMGVSYAFAVRDASVAERYVSEREKIVQSVRGATEGLANPLDRLLADLCLAWPGGVSLARFKAFGQSHVVTGRVYPPGVGVPAHQDDVREHASESRFVVDLLAQFGLNLHLACPGIGGELLLYLSRVTPEEFNKLRGNNYGVPPELLGEPRVSIKPTVGELILFDTSKLHAVAAGDGFRVTLSAFLGIAGTDAPLSIWV